MLRRSITLAALLAFGACSGAATCADRQRWRTDKASVAIPAARAPAR